MAQTSSSPFTVQIAAAPPPLAASFRLTSTLAGYESSSVYHRVRLSEGGLCGWDDACPRSGRHVTGPGKRQWNDGSIKHAVISGHATLTANSPLDLQIAAGTPSGGAALTSLDIVAALPTASVQCGAIGTVQLATLLATPFRTWVSGPEMSSAITA